MHSLLEKTRGFIKSLDVITLGICLMCSVISMSCLYSFYYTGQRNLKVLIVQGAAILLGLAVALLLSMIDYEAMMKLWKLHAPLAVGLVLLTFVIGVAPNPDAPTDRAWLSLGITTFQPSELLKLSFILTFSMHLSHVGNRINHLKEFLLLCLHAMFPVALIIVQSDYGTAMVFLIIFLVMNPEQYLSGTGKGWQQYLGRNALGSGQLSGRGLFSNGNLVSVPEAHNDFIFSYIGQTMGFVGCILTLLLLTALCVRILMVARMSKDKAGMLICSGVFAMLFFQIVVNIGMVLCIFPVVGVTLPFFSAGGTSAVVSYMAIGLVLSVYRKNKKTLMFD